MLMVTLVTCSPLLPLLPALIMPRWPRLLPDKPRVLLLMIAVMITFSEF